MTVRYHNVNTHDRFVRLIDMLLDWGETPVAIDIETTGLDAWLPGQSVVSVSLTACDDVEDTWVVPLDHPQGPWGKEWQYRLGEIADALNVGGVRLVAHNAGFDLGWITRFTDTRLHLHHDTQTWAHLVNENRSKRLKNLAAPLMGGDWGIDVRDTKGTPWFTLAQYNAQDTVATSRLYLQQKEKFSKRVTLLHERTVLPAQRVLLDVTHRGLWLDRPEAEARLLRSEAEADEAAMSLMNSALLLDMDPDDSEAYPTVSWEPTSKWFIEFADRSVEDGSLEVQELTPTGRPSWRGGVLERLKRDGYEIAATLLNYRDNTKKAQFLRSWLDKADEQGRVHGDFNIARTSTGRLSSSSPNLQQVARDLKPVFGTDEGLFCEIDYSQVEMRVMAEMIHRTVKPDNPMLQAFTSDTDLHSMAATLVTGGRVDNVTKEERQAGKAVNFGFIFGMGASKFVTYAEEVYGVDFTLEQAEQVREGYFDLWAGLHDFHRHIIQGAHDNGFVQNLYYRRRHLPDLFTDDEYLVGTAERQAINAIIQSTASDMMLEALGRIHEYIPDERARIVGTVHDSVLLEVRDESIVEDVCAIMTRPSVRLTVPLEVEASIGKRWGQYDTVFTRSNA